MSVDPVLVAIYRLQFNRDFTFAEAARLVPYLDSLGVSHVYSSPVLKARAGSPHGYDIVDHDTLNPELGGEVDFTDYVDTLHRHDMGQILDIVPNHMGVGGSDNDWWLDVLEHGEASAYAGYFDIDWHPASPLLRNKLLLPFLGDYYGSVLERGELKLAFEWQTGSFFVDYYEHRFPLDPRTYPDVLGTCLDGLPGREGITETVIHELDEIISACRTLPYRTAPGNRGGRRESAEACKHRLAQLCRVSGFFARALQQTVAELNGREGRPQSFDHLHRLLERQAWRLAYWKVAADEINYRRFFDINDLAGLRMENQEVFLACHERIRAMLDKGQINGVRVDHVDGLSDPAGYCQRLRRLLGGTLAQDGRLYLVVEKILGVGEELPPAWPVHGTTGYEFARLANGLFVHPSGEEPLSRTHAEFVIPEDDGSGRPRPDFGTILYNSKKAIIHGAMAGELSVLANLFSRIARADRHTRDYTYNGLREALSELAACFPVYRSYVTGDGPGEEDIRAIDHAVADSKRRSPLDGSVFDFIRRVILTSDAGTDRARIRRHLAVLRPRFQQFTSMVAAKGMEDTACYRYHRLASLNDVGFDPREFTTSPAAFHRHNRRRLETWPLGMTSTSTHDSKRGEDVRARINVLSEVAELWDVHVRRWEHLNRDKKQQLETGPAPCERDEYLLYQTLAGTWPLEMPPQGEMGDYIRRLSDYMIKAAREAKCETSWTAPDAAYEKALAGFVATLLDPGSGSEFQADFMPFLRRILPCGLYNALSQTALKLTAPGVPDIYQGSELWHFALVDPDNRRPVNFDLRREMLSAMAKETRERRAYVRDLLGSLRDGRAKLYLTRELLRARCEHPALFRQGDYHGLDTAGGRMDHLVAFSRSHGDEQILVVVARWFARLLPEGADWPPDQGIWADTAVVLPPGTRGTFRELLSGRRLVLPGERGDARFPAAEALADFPVAVWIRS